MTFGSALTWRNVPRARASRVEAFGHFFVLLAAGFAGADEWCCGDAVGSAVCCAGGVFAGVGDAAGVLGGVRVGFGVGDGDFDVAAGVGCSSTDAPDSVVFWPVNAFATAMPAIARNTATTTNRTPLRWLCREYLERFRYAGWRELLFRGRGFPPPYDERGRFR